METKKAEKKARVLDKDREHEDVKEETKSQEQEEKGSSQLRSTMIKEEASARVEAGAKEHAAPKAKAPPKEPWTTQFTSMWGLLNGTQLAMLALIILLGMVLSGFIGSRMATRTDLGTRLGDLDQRVADLSNKVSHLNTQVSDLQQKNLAGSPAAEPPTDDLGEPLASAAPSARPSP